MLDSSPLDSLSIIAYYSSILEQLFEQSSSAGVYLLTARLTPPTITTRMGWWGGSNQALDI